MDMNMMQILLAAGKGGLQGDPGSGQLVDIGNGYMAFQRNPRMHRLSKVLGGALGGASDNAVSQMQSADDEARKMRLLEQKHQHALAENEQRFNFGQMLNGQGSAVSGEGAKGTVLALPPPDLSAWSEAGLNALNGVRNAPAPVQSLQSLQAPPLPETPATGAGIWNGYTPTQRSLRTGGMF